MVICLVGVKGQIRMHMRWRCECMMNDIQQSTFDYMVEQYGVGRPKAFKEAYHFDLFTIHMMREIMNLEASDETHEVAQAFSEYVTQSNLILHNLHNKS